MPRPLRALLLAGLASGGCFHDVPPDFATSTTGGATTNPATTDPATTDPDLTSSTGTTSTSTGEPSTGNTQTTAAPDLPADPPFACPDDPRLVACYLFEDPGDGFSDGSGNGWHGQMIGVAAIDGHRGLGVGTSALSKLAVLDASGPVGDIEWTMMAWIRLDALPPERAGVLDRDGDYGVFIDDLGHPMCTGGAMTLLAPKAMPLQEWHHLACVRTASGPTTLYIDAQPQIEGDLPLSIPPAQSTLELANDSPPSAAEALVGALDEVLLWNVALPAEQLCLHAGLC